MATYYVRKSGNDSPNNGLSAAAAFLTLGKAVSTVAAGDTVNVGAGVYRELLTLATAGSSGNIITWHADIDGSLTGDAGLVVISARADANSASTRANCIDLAYKNFNKFDGFVFDGGTGNCVTCQGATVSNFDNVAFIGCAFIPQASTTQHAISIDYNAVITTPGTGLRVTDCVFLLGQGSRGVDILFDDAAASSTQNVDAVIDGCVFIGPQNTPAILLQRSAVSNTTKPGGWVVNNCTFLCCSTAVQCTGGDNTATPALSIHNCVIHGCATGITRSGGTAGSVVEDNNVATAITYLSSVTGGGTTDTSAATGMLAGVVDLPLFRTLGFSPYRPFAPIVLPDGTALHGGVDRVASATFLPANGLDMYGNPRPRGRSAAYDAGAVEAQIPPQATTSGTDAGGVAMVLKGAAVHDLYLAVGTSLTTVTVKVRRDTNYSGSEPRLIAMNIPGVADQTATMNGATADDTYETLTVTFTPTSAGVARLRLESRDTSAAGEARFDTLLVS